MGVIISRFRRKKTTTEVLETLETEIKSIERDGEAKERRRARVIGRVMAYSVGLYVALAAMYYWQFAKAQFGARTLIHASPLLVLPLIVIFIRSGISWYYNWALNKNRVKLSKMREEKKKILEEVMNTETYKTAKEILDKYGSPDEKALKPFVPTLNVPATPGQLRQRQLALQNSTQMRNNSALAMSPALNNYGRPRLSSSQLPRPLLDNNRSALDKVVDYLLKDGPNHRMALICTECSSHNGMAMVEEFEFVSYMCAYCGHRNPARKLRPSAPPLPQAVPRRAYGSGDDSSMPSSGSDSDDEKKGPPNSNVASSGESDRPPSPEGTPVSNKNKED